MKLRANIVFWRTGSENISIAHETTLGVNKK
jgi:hypothetical protein